MQNARNRAQATTEMLFVLTEIILVLAAGFLIFGKINSIDNDQLFLKKFYARDLALTLDSIQALPGNINYHYYPATILLSKLTFTFTPTIVRANDEQYPVAAHLHQETTIDKPDAFQITKQGDTVLIKKPEKITANTQEFNPNKIACPTILTPINGPIVLDPVSGYNSNTQTGNQGIIGKNGVAESTLVAQIGNRLDGALKSKGFTVQQPTRAYTTSTGLEDAQTMEQRRTKTISANTIISIRVNKDDKDKNNIKAFVNFNSNKYLESVKLACTLLNALSDKFIAQTTGAAIIPVDLHHFDDEDPQQILDKTKTAVQIEVGNIDGSQSFVTDITKIGDALAQGVSAYTTP